uniref:Carboxylic ester hydrolase n=1 Tax=Geotrichum candidum TaxID=1173061 RepID=Q12616_GEOCN|nr:triacylglycerol lipase [Geotrichum candidum]
MVSKNIVLAAALNIMGALAQTPTAVLNVNQVISGVLEGKVDTFKGIPFGAPPVGDLRFKHPQPFTGTYQGLKANDFSSACMQLNPGNALTILDNALSLASISPENIRGPLYDMAKGSVSMSEDCLYLNVCRPAGTKPGDKLPVMVWIYGGAFIFGSSRSYPGNGYVDESVKMGQPVVFVSINYRSGPYGFLGGDGITAEGNTNAGLHDQRKGLEWVSDNIANFGGDPCKVMIFGESAGAMSVGHLLIAYGGDNTYNGKALFHSAILQSGGPLPYYNSGWLGPDSAYNRFAKYAGCDTSASDVEILQCLRSKPSSTLSDAQNSYDLKDLFGLLPQFLGFGPRPDGDIIPDSAYELYRSGRYAKVPYITGNQEDEGTILAPVAINATTTPHVKKWLKYIFNEATDTSLDRVLKLYPETLSEGSPFRTGILNALTPQFKRVAAIFTDLLFQSPRDVMLNATKDVNRWTFLATQLHNLVPFLGTFHASDVLFQYYLNIGPSDSYLRYFISFRNHHDPNVGTGLQNWAKYTDGGKEMLEIKMLGNSMRTDDFRIDQIANFESDVTLFG